VAIYVERNGRLVPVSSDGEVKKGTQFSVAMGSSRTPFSTVVKRRMAEEQAAEPEPELEAPAPPDTSTPIAWCLNCEARFATYAAAVQHASAEGHVISDHPPPPAEPAERPAPSRQARQAAEQVMADTKHHGICANPECNQPLPEHTGKGRKPTYCCDSCKRKATYLRKKARAAAKAKGGTNVKSRVVGRRTVR
jgi:hypothetical protein